MISRRPYRVTKHNSWLRSKARSVSEGTPIKRVVYQVFFYMPTDEEITPDYDYSTRGNLINAKTLDLSCEWTTIEKQLKQIADSLIQR